jgi:hypothetical protein
VWRVDLAQNQNSPSRPALQLVQADGQEDLELSANLNQGDSGDPFPGSFRVNMVDETGLVSTSFPGAPHSGIRLSGITLDPQTGVIRLSVAIQVPAPAPPTMAAEAPLAAVGATPAEPMRPVVAGLANLLKQPRISPAELAPLVREVTPTPLDLQRRVLAAEVGMGPMTRTASAGPLAISFAGFTDPSSFDGWWFQRYKANFGVEWDMQGQFLGVFDFDTNLFKLGEQDYLYTPDAANPLRFVRSTGEIIQPGRMRTDGGSVPRPAWVIPDINPYTYIKAYLVHDWDFSRHHCDDTYGRNFEVVNLTLGEGIYTLMRTGEVNTDWRKVELVYEAVSSFVGRGVWDRIWQPDECLATLPGDNPPGTT